MAKKVFELIDLLERNGGTYFQSRGDHHKFKKTGARRSVIVPGARNDTLPAGTLAAILRETGLTIK